MTSGIHLRWPDVNNENGTSNKKEKRFHRLKGVPFIIKPLVISMNHLSQRQVSVPVS